MTSAIAIHQEANETPVPSTAAQTFAERIAQALDSAAVALMLGLGHRSGLLETLSQLPAATSVEIARAAGLSERYVREWLAALVVGKVVEYDSVRETYRLPADHAACLTPNAPLGNLAVYAQLIGMAGAMQDQLLDCFKTGAGLQYTEYPHFHAIMAEDSAQTVVAQLFDTLQTLAPELTERLHSGITVMDAGCGSGQALVALAQRFPRSRFLGRDLCEEAIARARGAAQDAELSNLTFERMDLAQLRDVERYDLILSFDAVHDTKDPEALLSALHRALRPGGLHVMQDIAGSARLEDNVDMPFAPFLYTVSCMHCTPVSLGQGGKGLGTMWGWQTALRMLKAAGYADVQKHILSHDPMNVWFVSRKAELSEKS